MMLIIYVLTLLSANLWPALPSEAAIILCAALACICFFGVRSRPVAVILLAVAIMGWHGQQYRQAVQQAQFLVPVSDVHITSVQQGRQGLSYKVLANLAPLSTNYLIRLSWPATLRLPKVGETWQVQLKLKPPHDYGNPASFNYRRYLLSHHIIATGYVVNAKPIEFVVNSSRQRILAKVQAWRHLMQQKLQQYESGPLLMAMTLGERSAMSKQHWQVLSKTGTAHLMAISGLHLGICFAWLLWLLTRGRRLGQRLGLLRNELPVIWPLWLAAALSGGYPMLSGLAIPTVRAWLFILIYCALKSFHLRMHSWRLLVGVAALLLTQEPQQAYSTSFWLSFTAVACVLIAIKLAQGWQWLGWRRLVFIQLIILAFMLPLQAGNWGLQSLLAPLINLVVIPWLGLTILPLAILGVASYGLAEPLASAALTLADWQLSNLFRGLSWLSQQTWQLMYLDLVSAFIWLFGGSLIVVSFFFRRAWRRITWVILPLCYLGQSQRNYIADFTLDLLDVGQGQALVIRKFNEVVVYDVGPAYPSGFNLADGALNPYFQAQGISKLQALIISHSDMDHAGGERYLWPELGIALRVQPEQQTGYLACRRGMMLELDALQFEFLSPNALLGNDNDDSCVVKVGDGSASVLLTGDISKDRETELVREVSPRLKADVLLVPHHGSRSSSSNVFIRAVNPDWALVSTGFANRWRFPSVQISRRFEQQHIPLLNTAELGQIRLQSNDLQWHWQGDCQLRWPVWYRCAQLSSKSSY